MSIGSWLALPSELPESPLRVTRPMQRLCGSAGALFPLPVPSLPWGMLMPSLSPLPVPSLPWGMLMPSPLPGGCHCCPCCLCCPRCWCHPHSRGASAIPAAVLVPPCWCHPHSLRVSVLFLLPVPSLLPVPPVPTLGKLRVHKILVSLPATLLG